MGMNLSVHVGPYYTVPKGFDWFEFGHIVSNGRMEAGTKDDVLYLVPNVSLPGIDREMRVDEYGEHDVAQISPATIVRENAAFAKIAEELIKHCDDNGIEIHEAWGVVPCWS